MHEHKDACMRGKMVCLRHHIYWPRLQALAVALRLPSTKLEGLLG